MAAISTSRDVASSRLSSNCLRVVSRARHFSEQVLQTRVFAHDLLSAFAIIEQARVRHFALELFEAFAFELDEGI
jgi:hypothetical protein